MNLTLDEVKTATREQLQEFVGDRLCADDNCYRYSAQGYVLCLQCLHGTSERGDDELVAAKKRLKKLSAK